MNNIDFIDGIKLAFNRMSENCNQSHFVYDMDSHCSGYNGCRTLEKEYGWDEKLSGCSFDNCPLL